MKSVVNSPKVKHLVLIGGGHSHLAVLRRLAMKPVAGLALTLISREVNTPYSGSLPGHIVGTYDLDEIHIDLHPLARFAGARLIQADVEQIDLVSRTIQLPERPDIGFDLLSLNIGSSPDDQAIAGADKYALGIKPIANFLQQWQKLRNRIIKHLGEKDEKFTLAVVGGGPASIEFALAAQQSISDACKSDPSPLQRLAIVLLTADQTILGTHNVKVQQFMMAELQRRGIEVRTGFKVTRFRKEKIESEEQEPLPTDASVFATGASIPAWPRDCGLAISNDGFIEVNTHLQSTSHDYVFCAGDAASIVGHPRPKSGVYAVRHGKPLAENLVRYALGKRLRKYIPQRNALALMNLANGSALASRNSICLHGTWVGRLKHQIDSAFLNKYSRFPAPENEDLVAEGLADADTRNELKNHAMRCAGCAAKLSSDTLEHVLGTLPRVTKDDALNSPTSVEDASIIRINENRLLIQSIDQVKAFIDDPWIFARIATNHCLSDLHAMGAIPHSALAVVGLPYAAKHLARAQLTELMEGCSRELLAADCALTGGHTAETSELLFGLCVNGFVAPEKLLRKQGLRVGDVLILTKPLGTGCLLAADMRYQASHRWIEKAIGHMLQSNQAAVSILQESQASACTDITGFGLAGHLLEMLSGQNLSAELVLSDISAMNGALQCLQKGVFSSLHKSNSNIASQVFNNEAFLSDPHYQLLFDPQTSGGLLAGVPADQADDCLHKLHEAGFGSAVSIGQICDGGSTPGCLVLK